MSVRVMEEKRSKAAKVISGKKAFDFVGDIKTELKKVSWTNREELKVYTKVVVGVTFFFGLAVYFADVCIQYGLAGLNTVLRLITG